MLHCGCGGRRAIDSPTKRLNAVPAASEVTKSTNSPYLGRTACTPVDEGLGRSTLRLRLRLLVSPSPGTVVACPPWPALRRLESALERCCCHPQLKCRRALSAVSSLILAQPLPSANEMTVATSAVSREHPDAQLQRSRP